jgi:hypoxanthine phosphoribosyltransferase
MPNTIQVWDKHFEPFLPESEIQERVRTIAAQINLEYEGRWPLFIAVLNGAFMFSADLFRHVAIQCEITFVKLSSYRGMASTGQMQTLLGLSEDLRGRDLIVVEDIVDSGLTINHIREQLSAMQPASVRVASLLLKPGSLKVPVQLDYIGFEVPDHFLLGYGLDYNGRGRNLRDIYHHVERS